MNRVGQEKTNRERGKLRVGLGEPLSISEFLSAVVTIKEWLNLRTSSLVQAEARAVRKEEDKMREKGVCPELLELGLNKAREELKTGVLKIFLT